MLKIDPTSITTMAHNTRSVKGTPWEDVGFALPQDASLEDTLAIAGLNWGVLKRQAWIDAVPPGIVSEEGVRNRDEAKGPVVPKKVAGNYVLTRDDTMEPISPFVGARYKPIQNADAFEVFREFCEAGNMTMETAGSLFGGQHIWGLAKINGDYELADGEIISGYFLLMQSHVYGSALKAMFTPVRYPGGHTMVQGVNRNGLGKVYTMSHSRVWNEHRMAEVKEVIGAAESVLADFVDDARDMANTPVNGPDAVMYFIETFHPVLANKIKRGLVEDVPQTVAGLADWADSNRNLKKVPQWLEEYDGADMPSCQGTAWGIMQATNYAYDHVIGNGADTRLVASWMGPTAKKKLKALARIKKLGGAS